MNKSDELRMLLTIVPGGTSKKVTKLLNNFGIDHYQIFMGRGTCPKEIFSYLGLDNINKEVILCVVKLENINELFKVFEEKLKFNIPGHGVSCSIPVSSVASMSALNYLISES